METATVREALGLSNTTKAITPYTLREVLKLVPTKEEMKDAIDNASLEGYEIDLTSYAKKTDLPTKLSELENDKSYVYLSNGLIPSSYIPSTIATTSFHSGIDEFPIPGEPNKLYIDTLNNNIYIYRDGYIELNESLSLGEDKDSAFRGDLGLIAFNHVTETGNVHELTLYDLGINVSAETINNLLGLNDNILTLLSNKLNKAGDTMSGPLLLSRNPVERLEAATKQYVDTEINSIGVKVTTNVNKLQKLEDTIDGQKEALISQRESIATITNKVTGVEETVQNIEENFTEIEKGYEGIKITVGETVKIVEDVQQSVKLFSCDLPQNSLIIPVNENNKALETKTYSLELQALFKNTTVIPTLVNISPNNTLITIKDNDIDVLITKGLSVSQTSYSIIYSYEDSGKTYIDTVVLTIIPIQKGKDGDGSSEGGAHIGEEPPEDTEILWVDTVNNVIKRYTITEDVDDEGNPIYDWRTINEVDLDAVNTTLEDLEEKLKKDLDNLNLLMEERISNSLSIQADSIKFEYEKYYSEKITEVQSEITEDITNINTELQSLVTIKRYMSWENGNLTFGEKEGDTTAYTLQIDNDSILINYKGKVLSQWFQNRFEVANLIITEPDKDYGFAFVLNTNGSFSLKRVSIEREVTE